MPSPVSVTPRVLCDPPPRKVVIRAVAPRASSAFAFTAVEKRSLRSCSRETARRTQTSRSTHFGRATGFRGLLDDRALSMGLTGVKDKWLD